MFPGSSAPLGHSQHIRGHIPVHVPYGWRRPVNEDWRSQAEHREKDNKRLTYPKENEKSDLIPESSMELVQPMWKKSFSQKRCEKRATSNTDPNGKPRK